MARTPEVTLPTAKEVLQQAALKEAARAREHERDGQPAGHAAPLAARAAVSFKKLPFPSRPARGRSFKMPLGVRSHRIKWRSL